MNKDPNYKLEDLKAQRDIVALEGFFSGDSGITARFAQAFPMVANAFSSFTSRFSNNQPTVALTSKQRDLLKLIQKQNYMDVMGLMISCPEGLDKSATYLDYGMALMGAVERALQVEATINNYTKYLAMFITNKEAKLSVTNSDRVFKEMEKDRARTLKALGTYFTPGGHDIDCMYGNVIKRNIDWGTVFGLCEKLSGAVESIKRSVLIEKINETSEMLDRIIGMIKRKEIEGITPQAMQELANGAYQVASELEFFAIMHYRTLAYVEAINRSVLRLNDILK
jgi:hypothetical protein